MATQTNLIEKLDLTFDINLLKEQTQQITASNAFEENSYSPQHRSHSISFIQKQGGTLPPAFKEDFKNTYFYQIFKELPFTVQEMRLIKLMPNECYMMHKDEGYKYHLPIFSNEGCIFYFFKKGSYHLLPDGSLYKVNATILHTAFNSGPTERIHLLISEKLDDTNEDLNK